MGFTNFISEAEAMHVCGVSAKTLARFAEAGYLSIEKESDGLKLYSTNELEKVFGKSPMTKRVFRKEASGLRESVTVSSTPNSAGSSELDVSAQSESETLSRNESVTGLSALTNSSDSQLSSNDSESVQQCAPTPDTTTEQRMNLSATPQPSAESVNTATAPNSQEVSSPIDTKTRIIPPIPSSPSQHEESPPLRETNEEVLTIDEREELIHLRADNIVLQRVNEVNEKIIELREERIQEVTKERDWLRERVEKLEQKAERDQILLMSETQLLRQVMEQHAMQRSPMRKALEWIGLVEPPKSPFQSGKDRVVLGDQ